MLNIYQIQDKQNELEHGTVIHLIFRFIMLQKLQHLMQKIFMTNTIPRQSAT
jgi:hypothetical protein